MRLDFDTGWFTSVSWKFALCKHPAGMSSRLLAEFERAANAGVLDGLQRLGDRLRIRALRLLIASAMSSSESGLKIRRIGLVLRALRGLSAANSLPIGGTVIYG
jgi:hypothetical protein